MEGTITKWNRKIPSCSQKTGFIFYTLTALAETNSECYWVIVEDAYSCHISIQFWAEAETAWGLRREK